METKTIENNVSTPNKAIPPGVKRLPWDELQKRREKGLCFNCDERFIPGHRCKIKQAFLTELVESSDEEVQEEGHTNDAAEISIYALVGIRGPRTLRMESWINGRRVMVLIDSGSTHNFISHEIEKKMSFNPSRIETFSV